MTPRPEAETTAMTAHEFRARFLASVDAISPEEGAQILTGTSVEAFIGCLRHRAPAADSLTDIQLDALHEAMCERLRAKVGQALHSWEGSAPVRVSPERDAPITVEN